MTRIDNNVINIDQVRSVAASSDASDAKPSRTHPYGARIILSLALASFALGSWQHQINANPQTHIPGHAVLAPNARDYFILASAQIRDPERISDMTARQLPGRSKARRSFNSSDRAAVVAENSAALATLQTGLRLPYMEPPIRSTRDSVRAYTGYRDLAGLLTVDISLEASHGDWSRALNRRLDVIQLAEGATHGGPLLGCLIGASCQEIARNARADIIRHLNANQARNGAHRLEGILRLHAVYSDIMQEEEYVGQAMLSEMFREPAWRRNVALATVVRSGGESSVLRSRMSTITRTFRIYTVSKRDTYAAYTQYMDHAVENSRLPYSLAPPLEPIPSNPVCEVVLPVIGEARRRDVETESQNARLLLALALQAYFKEMHLYPRDMSELTPRYLQKLPPDPMALSGSFGYRQSRGNYRLYSNGLIIATGR